MIHRIEDKGGWDAFIAAMHSGNMVEIDDEMYDYWLEALPPIFMNRSIPWPNPKQPTRYDFGFAEGAEPITVFWSVGERRFCQRTNIMNPYAFV